MEDFERVYYDTVYRATKTILRPVVDAISDSISDATQRGVRDALQNLNPTVSMWDFFLGKRDR